MIRSYLAQIEDRLEGETPRQKFEYLENIISENSRAKGRIDFCKNQFEILYKDAEESGSHSCVFLKAIIDQLSTPI